jgi:hypothetical protein
VTDDYDDKIIKMMVQDGSGKRQIMEIHPRVVGSVGDDCVRKGHAVMNDRSEDPECAVHSRDRKRKRPGVLFCWAE